MHTPLVIICWMYEGTKCLRNIGLSSEAIQGTT